MNGPEEHKNEEQIDDFERSLGRAMRRVDVRAETAAKFLALAAEAEQQRRGKGGGLRVVKLSSGGRVLAFPKAGRWLGIGVAAALAVGVFAGEQVHRAHQREQAEQQFAEAMRVTDRALDHTRVQLERAGLRMVGQVSR